MMIALVARRHVAVVRAVHRVVLEQVRERLRVGEIVDGDELDVGNALLLGGADDLPADAAEAVDADANGHDLESLLCEARSPIAGARPKVTITDDACARGEQGGRRTRQGRRRRDDVVDEDDVRATQRRRGRRRREKRRETLRRRSAGVNRVCVRVARTRARHPAAPERATLAQPTGQQGALIEAALPLADRRQWHRHQRARAPRSRHAARRGAPSAPPSHRRRAVQPPYFSAWTICAALPVPSQHTLRAARTYGGSPAHHRHSPTPSGCPHRSQRGCGSGGSRDQQRRTPHHHHFAPAPAGRRRRRAARGGRAAPRRHDAPPVRPAPRSCERAPHCLARRRNAQPSLERERALLDEHRAGRRAAREPTRAGAMHPRRFSGSVDEVDHHCLLLQTARPARGARHRDRATGVALITSPAPRTAASGSRTTARTTGNRAANRAARVRCSIVENHLAVVPLLRRGQHGGCATAGAEHCHVRPGGRRAHEVAHRRFEAAHVGVVAVQRAGVIGPEGVDRAHALGQGRARQAELGGRAPCAEWSRCRPHLAVASERQVASNAAGGTSSAS